LSSSIKDNVFYFDECGIDLNIQKEYGYGKKEERLLYDKIGQRFRYKESNRLTVMSCIDNNNNYIAPFRFEGNTDTNIFISYLKQILIPELKNIRKYKLKHEEMKLKDRLTVILDNASFHKSKEIDNLFEKNKINILYLPSYSPDLNPIEKKWAQLKAKFRKYTNLWIFNKDYKECKIKDKIRLIDNLLKIGGKNVSMYF
jgi:transposase